MPLALLWERCVTMISLDNVSVASMSKDASVTRVNQDSTIWMGLIQMAVSVSNNEGLSYLLHASQHLWRYVIPGEQ